MLLTFCDLNERVVGALQEAFDGLEGVSAVHGRFEDHADGMGCVVSPANSFGMMDGGFDLALSEWYGRDLQQRVQREIISEWRGEQPVGTCLLVPTGHSPAYVAHAPTMRAPMNIEGTDNVYVAMRAILLAVQKLNDSEVALRVPPPGPVSEIGGGGSTVGPILTRVPIIDSILCPGLGTATGGVSPEVAASQMRAAFDTVWMDPIPSHITWDFVRARMRRVIY